MTRSVLVFLFCLMTGYAIGQDQDYYTDSYRRFEDYVYSPNIKSVSLEQEGLRLSEPILQLGTDEKLVLRFDDLEADNKYYSYTIIHWTHLIKIIDCRRIIILCLSTNSNNRGGNPSDFCIEYIRPAI